MKNFVFPACLHNVKTTKSHKVPHEGAQREEGPS